MSFPGFRSPPGSPARSPARPAEGGTKTLPLGVLKLVVIEDDPLQQKAYRALAQRFGFEVELASRASDALRLVLQCRPDAVLLDLRVEDGDTMRLLASLKRSPETARTPVAIVSAYIGPEVEAKLAFFADVPRLAKPWTVSDLVALIARMTGRTDHSSHSTG